jgi:hypothetical protein
MPGGCFLLRDDRRGKDDQLLKIAPTDTLEELLLPSVTVQLFGPVALTGAVFVQLNDHPPKATPFWAGAVKVTVVFTGYVAAQTEPPEAEPGPQWMTPFVPVAESAVISQFVVFRPALKTVSVTSNGDASEPG